ncbi:MAG: hypothetical protein ABI970_03780 [Chloroflexota bacterium]
MIKDWPRYDQEDLPRFVDYLESLMEKDEQVVRFEIINSSNDTYIIVEPVGMGDDFLAGSKYEVVALVKKISRIWLSKWAKHTSL